MKVAISQPGYLPWSGFFDLIDQVDQFVLLDDAQFVRHSWDHRNRIKGPTGLQWLTVPVSFRGRFGQPLLQVEIRDTQFVEKHLRSIEVNYGKARHFPRYFPVLKTMLQSASQNLLDLNLLLIEWIARELGILTPMVRSSSLGIGGKRSERLVSICRRLGASEYVSPRTALYLLDDLGLFATNGILVSFQNYSHPVYEQRFPPFAAYASTVDLVLNTGPEAGAIMRTGRRSAFSPEQVRVDSLQSEAIF